MFAAAGLLSVHFYQTPNEWNENNEREEELNEMPKEM